MAKAIRESDRLGSGIVEDDFHNMIVKWAVPLESTTVVQDKATLQVCSLVPPPPRFVEAGRQTRTPMTALTGARVAIAQA